MRSINVDDCPAGVRFDVWREAAARLIHPMEVSTESAADFHGRMDFGTVGGLDIIRVRGAASAVDRASRHIDVAAPGHIQLTYVATGTITLEQSDDGSELRSGDITWYQSNRTYRVQAHSAFDLVHLMISERYLGLLRDHLPPRASAMPPDWRLHPMLEGFRSGLASRGITPTPPAADATLEQALVQLIASLGLGPGAIPGSDVVTRGGHSLDTGKKYINDNLRDPSLSPGSVADACHISVRYLHKLFSIEGMSISCYIWDARLRAIMGAFTDPANSDVPSKDIAAAWGFRSPAHFSRAFKAKFGLSPLEFRSSVRGA